MKTKAIISAIAIAMGLAVNAAIEKVATVQVADETTLVKAATTAGNLVGYPMLGMMATMGLADNPVNAELGAFRTGENCLFSLYVDLEKMTKIEDFEKAFGGGALVYAPAKSKQDFLTSKEGLVENDGVIGLKDMFLVYSEDEKWAAVATSAELAKSALADVAEAQKPMDGDFVRVGLMKPGIKLYSMFANQASKELAAGGISMKTMPSIIAVIDSLENGNFGLRIGDVGLDVRGKVTPVADSELSKVGATPLEGDALAFAPADSVYAGAGAQGCGCDFAKVIALYDGLVAAVKESGINTDWYKSSSDGTTFKIVCDVTAAIKYFISEEGQAAANAVNADEFEKKVMALYDSDATDIYKINPESKPFSFALSLPGTDSKQSMSALYAKILPEAAAKKPSVVCVDRYYAAVKALAPVLAAFVSENTVSILNAGIATLPSDDGAGIASAMYRDGSDLAFTSRVSAEEIRGFAAVDNAAVAYMSMAEAENCNCEEGDYEDGDDDDDDEE